MSEGSILARILEAKRARLRSGEYGAGRGAGLGAGPTHPTDGERFFEALARTGAGPRVIAEIKHRSPSAGEILPRAGERVEAVARAYRRGGAAALSVVVERDFFGGEPSWIPRAKAASGLPVLMKDFVVDEAQLDFALALGADAVLLIVAALANAELARLHAAARSRGLAVLVEAHDAAEAARAAACGATAVGVNARDLSTFRVDLEAMASVGRGLGALLPAGAVRVAESGVRERGDVELLLAAGYGAFLVGESLLRSPDPVRLLRRLRGEGETEVKVCGVTRLADVASCLVASVDQVGLNFSLRSPRRVALAAARALAAAARPASQVVAVFCGNARGEIDEAVAALEPDVLQLHEPPGPSTDGEWRLSSGPVPTWRTVRIGIDPLGEAAGWPAARLLFDAGRAGQDGGTGATFDWALLESSHPARPFCVAGGLTPGNVAEAVRRLSPDGVDTASGVESSPGVKDARRVESFVRAVRGVPGVPSVPAKEKR